MSRRFGLSVCCGALLVVAAMSACSPDGPPVDEPIRIGSVLGEGDLDGFVRADAAYTPAFPEDHGAHPDFRSEWWYFTGNLDDADGRRFGFQYTLFRFAVAPEDDERPSAWSTRQLWMGHLALTDVEGDRFFRAERFSRGGDIGLAGAGARPFRVWLEDWEMASLGDPFFPLRLSAAADDFGLALALDDDRGPVLQGDGGYSRKGPGEGNASHYYSYTRLRADGHIGFDGRRVRVTGEAWLDREWSTSALGEDVRGWDWFALQLDDASEVMFYRLRRTDGSADPLSAGTVTSAASPPRPLGRDAAIKPLRHWISPETGIRYPVAWRLVAPSESIDLEIDALLDGQEMATAVRYWEGAVGVAGVRGGRRVTGRGYLEMTGYDAPSAP
jgi:predicted secreted hydrolase